jgi:adenylate cyclase
MKFNKKKIIVVFVISILISLLLSSLLVTGFMSNLQAKLVDNFYGGKNPLDKIVIVGVDDKSLQSIGRWPWSREKFIDLLDNMDGAEVIGFDIGFYEASELGIDERFGEKLENFNVVMGAELSYDESVNGELLPIEPLRKNYGYVNVFTDKDGITRTIPFENSFALKIYEEYVGKESPFNYDRMLIDFIGKPKSFRTYSFVDVLDGSLNFEDKIVLIGATSPGLHDSFFVPTSEGEAMSGVEIHANALQTIINFNFLNKQSPVFVMFVIFLFSIFLGLISHFFSIRISSIFVLFLLIFYFLIALFLFNKGLIIDVVYVPLAIVLTPMANLGFFYILEKKHKEKLKNAFGKYVSPVLVEEIAKHPESVSLGGERKRITVLFSDIRGFTSISEKLEPEELVSLLNEYLDKMTGIILKKRGLVDKFIGDAVMAFWGAPLDEKDQEYLACEASINMLGELKELNKKWEKDKLPKIEIGIGLNTGDAIVGNIGSDQRFDYTAMGDNINLGSRLEGLTKYYGARIIVSESTYAKVKDKFKFRKLDIVNVKGKKKPVVIYELVDNEKDFSCFEKGLKLYFAKKWIEAIKEFSKCSGDKASEIYIERCEKFKKNSPSKDWDGSFTMTSK